MGIICAVVTIVQSTNDWMTVPGMLGYIEGGGGYLYVSGGCMYQIVMCLIHKKKYVTHQSNT